MRTIWRACDGASWLKEGRTLYVLYNSLLHDNVEFQNGLVKIKTAYPGIQIRLINQPDRLTRKGINTRILNADAFEAVLGRMEAGERKQLTLAIPKGVWVDPRSIRAGSYLDQVRFLLYEKIDRLFRGIMIDADMFRTIGEKARLIEEQA